MYIVFKFLIGVGTLGLSTSCFVLLSEITTKDSRAFVIGSAFGSEFGLFLMDGLAYKFRNWQDLQIAVTVCTVLPMFSILFFSESPRWLLSVGKYAKAEQVLTKIAKRNGKQFSKEDFDKLNMDVGRPKIKLGFTSLFKYPKTRLKFFIIAFIWISDSLVGYGVTLGTKNLPGNIYVNFTIIAVGCTFGCALGNLLVKYAKRRMALQSIFVFLCIISVIYCVVISETNNKMAPVILAMFATLLINAAFGMTYIYTVELFPTAIRSTALGTASMCSRIGGISAPFVVTGTTFWKPMPYTIYSIVSLVSFFLIVFLPETKGKTLPDGIEEEEIVCHKEEEANEILPVLSE